MIGNRHFTTHSCAEKWDRFKPERNTYRKLTSIFATLLSCFLLQSDVGSLLLTHKMDTSTEMAAQLTQIAESAESCAASSIVSSTSSYSSKPSSSPSPPPTLPIRRPRPSLIDYRSFITLVTFLLPLLAIGYFSILHERPLVSQGVYIDENSLMINNANNLIKNTKEQWNHIKATESRRKNR